MASGSESASHRLFAALYDPAMTLLERDALPPHRAYLVADLSGDVLDLGAGTGAMFPYFAAREGAAFHAIEPDPHMRKRAERTAADCGLEIEIRAAGAEALPYGDGAFDAVIASIVCCTIPDVEGALDEVARVLRPGGEFRFLEHVRADGVLGRVQELSAPVWRRAAGGCRPDRETLETIAAHPGLDLVEAHRLDVGAALARPFVRGRAIAREDA